MVDKLSVLSFMVKMIV